MSVNLRSIKESPLYLIANPSSIAFFGASNKYTAMGTSQLTALQSLGFGGAVYPIHPREKTVLGLKAYERVHDVPEVPDLAVLVLPTQVVPEVMKECGEKGIKRAIVVSGGFQEIGREGVGLQKQLMETADKYNIRYLGPNCIGIANPHFKLNTTFLQDTSNPGFIGMASQSGSFITQMFDYLARYGLGFSTGFSVGNEANIDIVDCMEYLALCPHTKVIALYIEGIRRGRKFIDTARSIVPEKPIVAYYIGGSEAGKRAGFSHTGALAGPDELYDGVFRQSGIIRARTIEELFDFSWVLGSMPAVKGNRVVIQTHSGGPGAAAADACDRSGLDLPELSSRTIERLKPYVPYTGSVGNPVDITFSKNPADYYSRIPNILLEDNSVDALIMYFLMPEQIVERALSAMGVPGIR